MDKKSLLKKAVAISIITIFFTTSILPTISGTNIESNEKQNIKTQKQEEAEKEVTVTCYNFGMPGKASKEIEMSQHEAEYLYGKIKELNFAVASDPLSERTQQLQIEIVDLADEYDLLPTGLSKNQVKKQYLQVYKSQVNRVGLLPQTQSKASEFLCTFVSTGSGGVLPIIALPRFIPFLMIPIPRLLMIWRAQEAVTSCGGLRSGTGFIAYGQQNGVALGFWGLGFTFSLPPLMGVYGLAGYALFATVDAEYIDFYPPNSPPVISQIDPGDGDINVPLSLSEIRFQISDLNGELMSYTVTTTPDIGSGSGNLKPDGVYSIPISGLEDLTEYSWHIEVTDGMDTTAMDPRFTTEAIAPIISNPSPEDGEKYVPLSLSHLSFHLKDFQGDPMDYTVETSPDIGSGSGTGVGEGTYSVPVNGLDYSLEYIWHVNVTDGEHQTNKIFYFQTEPVMEFDPFDEGWQYRKEITIDHTLVEGDLENFPILISTIDVDLRDKAQGDGDDILFMDGTDIANRLYHEIEHYESSSGKLVAWVNVTSLSSTTDTVIWLYYGNPGCSSQQHPIVVWDSDYIGVYHLADLTDSTVNAKTMTNHGASSGGTGKIGNCYDFEFDEGDYMDVSNFCDVSTIPTWTLEFWINQESADGYSGGICIGGQYGDTTQIVFNQHRIDTNKFDCGLRENKDDYEMKYSSTVFIINNWYYCSATITPSTVHCYPNGSLDDATTLTSGSVDMVNFGIDDMRFSASDSSGGRRIDGLFEEARISKIVRSANWIKTSFNTMNDPSSFIEVGPEEPAP